MSSCIMEVCESRSDFRMHNGARITIRPIRPDDEARMVAFHNGLSEHSVYMRYGNASSLEFRTAHERLSRVCLHEHGRGEALVAENPAGEIIAVGRLSKDEDGGGGEFALLVADKYQTQGLGAELLNRVLAAAQQQGLDSVYGYILPDNGRMQSLARELGFSIEFSAGEGLIKVSKEISK